MFAFIGYAHSQSHSHTAHSRIHVAHSHTHTRTHARAHTNTVPVVFEEGKGNGEEGKEKVEREEMLGPPGARELQQVEEEDGSSNDCRLSHLHAIDTS